MKSVKFFSTFKQSWFLVLVGIIAISLMIFFLGDVLRVGNFQPFSTLHSRYIAIGSLSAGVVIYHLLRWVQARKKNQKMVDSLVENAEISSEDQASTEEIELLSDNLKDALQALNTIDKKEGGKQDLYELPWFVIIGPPGAGKTTLLANSKLHFPLSDKYGKEAVRGVGGTRNCDWWFTDDAIILDTAGRYTTQDSRKKVDQAAWKGFLDLLRKNREHQPINGIIIAVSITDLLRFTLSQLESSALVIRNRIQELHSHLNITFPVYMIFTKCDLLSGFTEFYDDLDSKGRDQVWGMTFPYEGNSAGQDNSQVGLFESEFELLEKRVYQQLVEKLDKERSLDRRQALYLFPQQFSALKKTLNSFLKQTYHSSRFQQTSMLRGVYFTSATQEGTPIDRIMLSLASDYGVSPQQQSRFSDKGKSFFINQLLEKVIFPESGLAGTNVKLKRKLQKLQTFAAAAALMTALIASLLLLLSYFNNGHLLKDYKNMVKAIDVEIAQIPEMSDDLMPYLSVLGKARQLSYSYADQPPKTPLLSRFGLSQVKPLRQKMDSKYEGLLLKVLRPYAKSMLEKNIKLNLAEHPERIFGTLKTYLFLGGEAPEGRTMVVQGIDWNNNLDTSDSYDREINQHFTNLLSRPNKYIKTDALLVNEARQSLESVDISRLVYQSYKNSVIDKASAYNFDILSKEKLDQINLSFVRKSQLPWSDGVPGLFTKVGYENVFLPSQESAAKGLANDAWVLGKNISLNDVKNAELRLFNHYQKDYINQWSRFLDDIHAQSITNRDQAKRVFLALTANGGNLLFRLIQEVKNETHFTKEKKEGDKDDGSVNDSVNKISSLTIPESIESEFIEFTEWDEKEEFKTISQLLGEIHQLFSQDNTFEEVHNNSLKNALDKLGGEADKFPAPLRDIIKSLIQPSEQLVTGMLHNKALEQFKIALKEQVGDFCNKKIANYYPVKKNARRSIALADFTQFFQQGGVLDTFEKKFIKNAPIDSSLKKQVMKSFHRGKNIRDTFFSTGSLKIDYGLNLVSTHPNITGIELTIGSSSKKFEPGVVNRRIFSWPSSELILAIIEVRKPVGGRFETSLYQGDEWGIFRLIKRDRLVLRRFNGTMFRVFFPNPSPFKFAERQLRGFKCPII